MTVRINKPPIDLRSKLSELERPIGLKGGELMATETLQDARELIGAGRKNLFFNGCFRFFQRDNDHDNTGNGWGYYAADRWLTNKSRTRQVDVTIEGISYKAIEISPSADGTYNGGRGIIQRVEDYANIYQRPTVLSFYIKSSAPSDVEVGRLFDSGSGSYPGPSVRTDSVFTRVEYELPTFNPVNQVDNYLVNGLDDGITYTIANAQLEFGGVATPFEHRTFGEELELCQRYFEKTYTVTVNPGTVTGSGAEVIDFNGGNTSIVRKGIRFKTRKRTAPTVTFYNPSTGATGSARTNSGTTDTNLNGPFDNGQSGCFVDTNPSAGEFCRFHWAAGAEI